MHQIATSESIYLHLKNCISSYFQSRQITRFANPAFWTKAILLLLLTLTAYFVLLTLGEFSLWIVCLSYFIFNAGTTLLMVNLAHDAAHQCISPQKKINRFLSYAWNLMGISRYLWELQHHRSHHAYTGIPLRDVDIAENFWIRYNPTHRFHQYFRFQHLYAPILYMFFGLFVVFVKDFVMLYSGKLKAYGSDRLPVFFAARLLLTKAVYILVTILLPVWILPYSPWAVFSIYLISLSVCSGAMLLVLVIPHINEYAVSAETTINTVNRNQWTMQQLHANIDASPENLWLSRIIGGLNTHLVHHLFPNICHIHYPALTREIRNVLKAEGILYRERSFLSAIKDHFRFLKKMGRK